MTWADTFGRLEEFAELKYRYDRAVIVHKWLDDLVMRGEEVPPDLIRRAVNELKAAKWRYERNPLFQ